MRKAFDFPIGPIMFLICIPYLKYTGIHPISDAHRPSLVIFIIIFYLFAFFFKRRCQNAKNINICIVIISALFVGGYIGPGYP